MPEGPSVDKLARYRELLRLGLPSPTRHTIEWLLVNGTREFMALGPYVLPQGGNQAPRLISIANDAVGEAVELTGAQFGAVQLYLAPHDTLLLLAHRNFPLVFASRFAAFRPDGRTSCSRAVASGRRVVIEDVESDDHFAPHVPAALSAGFRSLQATPLKSRMGDTIGVLTTHFSVPRSFANDTLERLDGLAGDVSAKLAAALG